MKSREKLNVIPFWLRFHWQICFRRNWVIYCSSTKKLFMTTLFDANATQANNENPARSTNYITLQNQSKHTRILRGFRINIKCFPFFIRSFVKFGRCCFAICCSQPETKKNKELVFSVVKYNIKYSNKWHLE